MFCDFVLNPAVADSTRGVSDVQEVQRSSGGGAKGSRAVALERLRAAHEVYRRGGSRSMRLSYHIGALMAREQLVADDPASARRLLDSVAGSIRASMYCELLDFFLLHSHVCWGRG